MVYDPSLGYDDEMPNAFNKWMSRIDADILLEIVMKIDPKIEDKLWEYYANNVYPTENEPLEE